MFFQILYRVTICFTIFFNNLKIPKKILSVKINYVSYSELKYLNTDIEMHLVAQYILLHNFHFTYKTIVIYS
jgi:hypothetical protein